MITFLTLIACSLAYKDHIVNYCVKHTQLLRLRGVLAGPLCLARPCQTLDGSAVWMRFEVWWWRRYKMPRRHHVSSNLSDTKCCWGTFQAPLRIWDNGSSQPWGNLTELHSRPWVQIVGNFWNTSIALCFYPSMWEHPVSEMNSELENL